MPSTLDSKSDPQDLLEIAPDIVLVARAAAEFPSLAPDATHRPGDRQPNIGSGFAADQATPRVDTSFRATDTSGGRSRGDWARKALVTFLFALCSGLAVAAWERRDDIQEMSAGITPQIMPTLMSWMPMQKPAAAAQADTTPATESAAVRQNTPPPPQPAVQPVNNPIAAASASPVASEAGDQVQLLQSMARDVANLTQQIDELKATVAQLKASQEQLSRDKARPPEPRISEAKPTEPRPTKLGAPPRPLGTLVHRARPSAYPPPQSAYMPPPPTAAPVQIAPPPAAATADDDQVVVRPPMPVR